MALGCGRSIIPVSVLHLTPQTNLCLVHSLKGVFSDFVTFSDDVLTFI